MKAIMSGIAAVLAFLAAVGLSLFIIWKWLDFCNWLYGKNAYLAAALTPMAFVAYFILGIVFVAGHEAVRRERGKTDTGKDISK